jgi:hypothetical protein
VQHDREKKDRFGCLDEFYPNHELTLSVPKETTVPLDRQPMIRIREVDVR